MNGRFAPNEALGSHIEILAYEKLLDFSLFVPNFVFLFSLRELFLYFFIVRLIDNFLDDFIKTNRCSEVSVVSYLSITLRTFDKEQELLVDANFAKRMAAHSGDCFVDEI